MLWVGGGGGGGGGCLISFVRTLMREDLEWDSDEIKDKVKVLVNAVGGDGDATIADAASMEAFYAAQTRKDLILGQGKLGFVAYSETIAKQKVFNKTCLALEAAAPGLCTIAADHNAARTTFTDADYRTIMATFIASGAGDPTNVWPTDNADPANGIWDNAGWAAASEADQDATVLSFARYNGANQPLLDLMGYDQNIVDAYLGITVGDFAARMTALTGGGNPAWTSTYVPINIFDTGAMVTGWATFTGTLGTANEKTSTDWAALSAADQLSTSEFLFANAFNKGLPSAGAYAIVGSGAGGTIDVTSATDMEKLVESFATSIDTYYCKCADGGDWTANGCCLSSGKGGGTDLVGLGCLYERPTSVGCCYMDGAKWAENVEGEYGIMFANHFTGMGCRREEASEGL
eukprot:CAMPEP_0118643258 /NCGR_PEP_ID=MMETSP0785-20121206/6296_1 /TAXON_ID=91992 /ORGANISM="Bolidomonas pacifica, Strain CCMP 1866" /LENGTH=404 /DNA_ID=CAMNT_0006534911 /DNA_START=934 /DNA_END=2148 /DNA_ORIENTATION=-